MCFVDLEDLLDVGDYGLRGDFAADDFLPELKSV